MKFRDFIEMLRRMGLIKEALYFEEWVNSKGSDRRGWDGHARKLGLFPIAES